MWKVRINFGLRPNFGLSDRWDQKKKSTSLFADLRSQTEFWSQSLVSAKVNPKSEVTQWLSTNWVYPIAIRSAMLKSDIPHAAHQLPSSSVASFCSSGGSSWLLSLCWCSVNYSVHGVLKDRKYPRGSPWLTWLCIVESDLQHANTGLHSVRRCAQDCTVRRWFVETATLQPGARS